MRKALVGLVLLAAGHWAAAAVGAPQGGQLVTIGILPFQDDAGTGASPDFLRKAEQELRRQLSSLYKDVLPRPLPLEAPGEPAALSIERIAAVGRGQGARFVVRGGLLAATSGRTGDALECRLEFFGDLVDAESLAVTSFRAEGSGAEKTPSMASALDWASIDWNGTAFGRSALGQALSSALASLAEQVHAAAIAGPRPDMVSHPEQDIAAPVEVPADDAYQQDQDLQQVIAEAESLISGGGAANLGDISPLQRSLEGLLEAMDSKISLLEEAQDTSAVDLEIRQRQEELLGLVDTYSQQLAAAPPQQYDAQVVPPERRSLASTIQELLQTALTSLLQIQDIKAALGLQSEGAQEAYAGGEEYAGEYAYMDEQTSDISGVVYDESGYPVEGATVMEPETGASAVTDGAGAYTLNGIPGGRMAVLNVVRGGRTVAMGRVDVPAGQAGIADWTLRAAAGSPGASANRIIPSSCIAKSAVSPARSGTIQGVVIDEQQRPLSRTLVILKGIGSVRTDSLGRYTFARVPQGSFELTVQRPGSEPLKQVIKLSGRQILRPRTVVASAVPRPHPKAGGRVVAKGENTRIKGKVTDERGKALPRSKVTVLYPGGALSASANDRGAYEFRDLKQGKYRVLAAKSGYTDSAATVEVKKNGTTVHDFRLRGSSSAALRKAVSSRDLAKAASTSKSKNKSASLPPSSADARTRNQSRESGTAEGASAKAGPNPADAGRGGVHGTVLDGKTGKPVAGALVAMKGVPGVRTDAAGQFKFSGLKPGSYSASVKKTGFADGSVRFTVEAGRSASVRVRLGPPAPAKAETTVKR